ncbi:unnamed protein product [Rangifer tarandus platyrhynchus]|uniref:Uncharacterized protein n=2 Tax=Rangifer tarandus platyrhynchus TaxID=3082113 RepID=A0ACB0EAU4_RANTA|nr:unnamed protein product [Rangifer tarandus platyrhynchus]CAI9697311.1 unnamed protein product [Rangifer tarandus platyrhynchus]
MVGRKRDGAAHRGVFRTARAQSLEQFRPRPYLRIPTSYWTERLFILILGPIVSLRSTWRKRFWVLELAGAWSCGKYSSRNALIRARITY